VSFNRDSIEHPAFREFRDNDDFRLIGHIPVWKVLDVEAPAAAKTPAAKSAPNPKAAAPGGEHQEKPGNGAGKPKAAAEQDPEAPNIAIRYSDGAPALVVRKVGAGEVVLWTTAAEKTTQEKTNLPKWSMFHIKDSARVFIPFVHANINHLVHEQTQNHNLIAGERLVWHPTDKRPRSYTLVHPDGKQVRLGTPSRDDKQNRFYLVARDLPTGGIYRLTAKDASGGDAPAVLDPAPDIKGGVPIGVTPDLRESEDLESLSAEQITQRLGFAPYHITAGVEEEGDHVSDRLNREWTTWFLIGVLILVMGEAALAYWCGRAW
jgi:hypothetical protein